MDVLLRKRMQGGLLDENVCKWEGGGMSDYFGGGADLNWWQMEECQEDGGCEKCIVT